MFDASKIIPGLEAESKDDALLELASVLAENGSGVSAYDIYQRLKEREEIGSTGVGDHVALPHAKVPGLSGILSCFARSEKGVEFGCLDGEPARLFVCIVGPPDSSTAYLAFLAKASKLLGQPEIRNKLLAAKSAEEIYEIFEKAK